MAAKSCEERTLMFSSVEQLRCTIQELLAALEKAWRGRKPDKEGAQDWANDMDETIERARCLLKIRKQYPELEESFVRLAASIDRADTALLKYGINMDLPYWGQSNAPHAE